MLPIVFMTRRGATVERRVPSVSLQEIQHGAHPFSTPLGII